MLRHLRRSVRCEAVRVQRRGCGAKPPFFLEHMRQRWVLANHATLHRVGLIVGHGGYILGLLEYGVTDIVWLRLFAIGCCGMVLGYQLLQPRVQWITAGWMVVYVSINVYQLAILEGGAPARPLSWEEERLYAFFSQHMDPREFVELVSLGEWYWLVDGACLAEEGSDSADGGLVVVSMGSCDVSVHGRKVAELVPGCVMGEVALLAEGGVSSATVRARGSVRCIVVPAARVQALLTEKPEMKAPLERVLADSLASKLVGMNQRARARNYRAVLEVACQLEESEALAAKLAKYRGWHEVSDELHLRLVDELPQCVHRPFQLQAAGDEDGMAVARLARSE